ncbi:nucleoside triphosphate pyrophosphohydrolase [Thiotrichales bacterium 19S11-10]|nr:nucleoside triphosphate pyrophosphohydrolase [Thiotrichales bacterium 19S11-10]
MSAIEKKEKLEKLLEIMDVMRNSDQACQWTKAQTWDSLVRHTIEEAYEVADAVERGNEDELKGELADLLNQVVFYAQIAKEKGFFNFYDVMDFLSDKLIRRHPNVFANEQQEDVIELEKSWEMIKAEERRTKSQCKSVLDDIAQSLPALSVAKKLQTRAAQAGFDWPNQRVVFEKLKSEVVELEEALKIESHDGVIDEIGDILFSCVNLVRHLREDPEQVLRKANHKFERRFRKLELLLNQDEKEFHQLTLDQLEKLWQRVKESE